MESFQTKDVLVQVNKEYNAGIDGRVDILIQNDKRQVLVIENKIDATDQDKQLIRYHHFINEKFNEGHIFYLTLDGSQTSQISIKDDSVDLANSVINISYTTEILQWLELCYRESVSVPTVRETIVQYINLVKKLTGQNLNKELEKEMLKLIRENYDAARTIANEIEKVETRAVQSFLSDVAAVIENRLNHDDKAWIISVDNEIHRKNIGISIVHKNWPEKLSIAMESVSLILKYETGFGIYAFEDDIDRKKIKQILNEEVPYDFSNFKESPYWPNYTTLFNLSLAVKNSDRFRLFEEGKRLEFIESVARSLYELAEACDIPFRKLYSDPL
jgi:hypothetical protein